MTSSHSSPPPLRRQTTVLVGGSNGTAGLCALLGDKSNPHNAGHVMRVVTRSPKRFVDANDNDMPLRWRCNEQKHPYDAFPFLPTKWVTHVGAPDSVFVYSDDDSSGNSATITEELDPFERAISGVGAHDDGGAADCIILCCPVGAHLLILRRIARALHRLEGRKNLRSGGTGGGGRLPPLVIGTLYGAGGFDWMSRVAFASEKTPTFTGRWKRDMILFGLKAFPFLVKSTQAGIVNLYGRWPVLACALSPSTAQARSRTREVLGRVLQCEETGKRVDFVGISSAADLGGDGSAEALASAAAAAATMALAPNTKAKGVVRSAATGNAILAATAANRPNATQQQALASFASSLADHADPYSSLGYLSCTLNATNTFLHPCIMAALFNDPQNPGQSDANGTITWDPSIEKTAAPRFYADGGGKPEAGRLITAYAAELYPLLYTLDCLLAPAGMAPISSCHGGDNTARMVFNATGNSPRDLAQRTGLTDMVLQSEFNSPMNDTRANKPAPGCIIEGKDKLNYRQTFEFMCRKTLANNTRLAAVMTPVIKVDGNNKIRPNPNTRFFTDDVPHGLLIMLGLGELIGFDLERDMPEMLSVVRKLQRWMGKEYVLPNRTSPKQRLIIGDAKDLAETAAPQAFGVKTVTDLKQFLKLDPFGSDVQQELERNLDTSPIAIQSKL